ncbi:MAG: hypothetical protein Q8R13_03495 [bacterium]|nr:hypothetical protein [bacterium]MDZ4296449.1 hypothetical protein [Patescibacteria group bacterium]
MVEHEIERKFFVKKMPNLSGLSSIWEERYYLYANNGIELRMQKRSSEKYELERMSEYSNLSRIQEKIGITKEEFKVLKQFARGPIIRESYLLGEKPQITLKVYHGRFEGLVRVEVEFSSIEEAQQFRIPDWCGEEMTHMSLAKDAMLLDLRAEEFRRLIS